MFATQTRTACAGPSIDGEVVARAEPTIVGGELDFQGLKVRAGAESADHPAEEMSERREHSKNSIGIIRIQLFAKSFILQVYGVLARHTPCVVCHGITFRDAKQPWQLSLGYQISEGPCWSTPLAQL